MFVSVDQIAEMLDVSDVSVWRWAKRAGLTTKKPKRGRQQIPFCALINYLAEEKKIPLRHVEKEAYITPPEVK